MKSPGRVPGALGYCGSFAAFADAWRQRWPAMRLAFLFFTWATAFSPVRQGTYLICASAAAYSPAPLLPARLCASAAPPRGLVTRLIAQSFQMGRPFLGTASSGSSSAAASIARFLPKVLAAT